MAPNKTKKQEGVGIDIDGDGQIDGYYDKGKLKLDLDHDGTIDRTIDLRSIEMKQNETVHVTVELNLDEDRKIIFGLTSEIKEDESYNDAFKRAYLVCLNAIREHASE